MAYKDREAHKNNLQSIREELGYTQIKMGQILGVGDRMISNYEIGEHDLPLHKALILAHRYNYSLDYIYCLENTQKESPIHSDITQRDKFIVDIRDFISCSNNMIHFSIPENYWEYIHELNSIISTNKTDSEKKRLKAELDGKYIKTNRNKKVWHLSIPQNEIPSYIHFDSDFIPFADSDKNDEIKPTEEQLSNAISFLKEITK